MARRLKVRQECAIIEPQKRRRLTTSSGSLMEDSTNNYPESPNASNTAVWAAGEDILSSLPNDLTRLIYLTSIRDYNSGTYRHHVLSRQFDAAEAHRVFEAWHQQVFARLLTSPLRKYVEEIEDYIRYSRVERGPFITTWKSLQAYRAAVPLKASKRACETFFINVKTALTIVESLRNQTD